MDDLGAYLKTASTEDVVNWLRKIDREGGLGYRAHDVIREAATRLSALTGASGREVEATNNAYTERNRLVAFLAHLFPSGLKRTDIPGWDAEWHGCVYIDLPTGQASWHYHDNDAHLFAGLPPYAGEWDGHTTDEKYARLATLPLPQPTTGEAWQPIETAPDTGDFLAYEDGAMYRCRRYEEGSFSSQCGQPVVYSPEPTHWRPLPALPTEDTP